MKKAVEIKNYSFRYANTENWILKEADFTLNYGELIVLSGRSGEGKSTLLSSINGIIPYIVPGEQKGEIYVDGETIQGKRTSEIAKKVGSVLQNADSQIIAGRVEDEIAFGCENLNMPVSEIQRVIEDSCAMMGLDKDWLTKPLSGGQKQRLMTAAILAMKQKILVFDEPLANIDLEGAHMLLKTLKDLAANGYGILLIEHRLDVVAPYADKIAWIENEKIHVHKDKKEALKNTSIIITDPKGKDKKNKSEPCFTAENLSYIIPERTILKNLNFSIFKGERVVILGENGCGKTTLLRLLAKMLMPSEGKINQSIEVIKKRKIPPSWFKKLGFVYQNPNYQLFMPTVAEEVAYQSKEDRTAQEILKKFQLEPLRNRHPQSLSEGQKRRLTIAAVMSMEPEVLLLDEPTVGQDYKGLQGIIETLNAIHEATGNTMITITHDFRCAAALADRIFWMRRGEIYKIGGPELAEEYFDSSGKII